MSDRVVSCPIDRIVYPLPLIEGCEIKISEDGPWVTIREKGVALDEADLRRKVRKWEQLDD
jgi:hypothetical protein